MIVSYAAKDDYMYTAKVDRVVDGDTLDVTIDLGFGIYKKERVRLAGIDTPEVYGVKKDSEEYAAGKKASDRVEKLVLDEEVVLYTYKDKQGKYGRYIAEVYVTERGARKFSLNKHLVEEGLAESVKY